MCTHRGKEREKEGEREREREKMILIDFKELAHMIMEAGKSKIYRVGSRLER